MKHDNLNDLLSFIEVANEGNFTKAAAQLGVSQSALSYTIRRLEQKLGIRLLTRTTRSVSMTEAGQKLMKSIAPLLQEVQIQVDALGELRDKPAGNIRITTFDYVAEMILWPKIAKFLEDYPEINVELNIDYGLIDIVKQQFDAGVREGDLVPKDMIAIRISADTKMVVAGAKKYFKKNKPPKTPQDLMQHRCINMRLPTYGGLYTWEFAKDDQKINMRVEGQLTFNRPNLLVKSAAQGYGLIYLPELILNAYADKDDFNYVLEDWCINVPGYHLYYPSRRQPSPAFTLLVDALRYKRDT
ncbi:LysR family transcriptional regulator [Gammaproteobacteria bacterium ESL0073]|nr:LysR family transcriptional regulator [Gammaproteobacteria bacterium ESL0073]